MFRIPLSKFLHLVLQYRVVQVYSKTGKVFSDLEYTAFQMRSLRSYILRWPCRYKYIVGR
jgi:hypothetical protein